MSIAVKRLYTTSIIIYCTILVFLGIQKCIITQYIHILLLLKKCCGDKKINYFNLTLGVSLRAWKTVLGENCLPPWWCVSVVCLCVCLLLVVSWSCGFCCCCFVLYIYIYNFFFSLLTHNNRERET